MKTFIGTKMVKASPMTRQEYNDYRDWELPSDENGTDTGYLVEYLDGGAPNHPDHEGYISWSPTEVFDAAYLQTRNIEGLPEYAQRMAGALAQLDDRIESLCLFVTSDQVKALPSHAQELLKSQLTFMEGYSAVLSQRLDEVS